jgi:hypothetical protein
MHSIRTANDSLREIILYHLHPPNAVVRLKSEHAFWMGFSLVRGLWRIVEERLLEVKRCEAEKVDRIHMIYRITAR